VLLLVLVLSHVHSVPFGLPCVSRCRVGPFRIVRFEAEQVLASPAAVVATVNALLMNRDSYSPV
jgi:hypothetical protein